MMNTVRNKIRRSLKFTAKNRLATFDFISKLMSDHDMKIMEGSGNFRFMFNWKNPKKTKEYAKVIN